MSTLLHHSTPVHPIAIVGLPETLPDDDRWTADDEPFIPSPEDLAWDTGFTIGLEDGEFRPPHRWSDAMRLRYIAGRHHGTMERERRAARELGEALGYATEISEPPPGLKPLEAAAFRDGFAAGKARFEAEREHDAYLEELASDAADMDRMTDADIYPIGCVS